MPDNIKDVYVDCVTRYISNLKGADGQ